METFLQNMRGLIAATPARWLSLAQALPEELLARPAAPGEWSALECLRHMIDTETVYQFRVKAFLEGRDFPDFNPAVDGSQPQAQTPQALVAEFARLRGESLALLETLAPADLERQARHAELGLVTLCEMLNHWAAHDLNHTVQAERALMQPLIQNCGPWERYYSDHKL
jgi:uncharacterized damage-inducible protein DinB